MARRLEFVPTIALLGLLSGVGAGAALLIFARSGLSALLGDAGFYLVLFGVGWFTGKALHGRLSLPEMQRVKLSATVALAYAAGVDPLDALLVDYGLTGVGVVPSLWLAAVTALLTAVMAWTIAGRTPRTLVMSALVGIAAMAAIVVAVNLLALFGAPTVGIWAIHLVPALWLPCVVAFVATRERVA